MIASGVYRAAALAGVASAFRGGPAPLERIGLHGVADKATLLRTVARALAFPDWFGENWDALEDCLSDLSWREAHGHLLVFEGFESLPQDDLGVLIDILETSAAFWASRGKTFVAVFVDPQQVLPLAPLPDAP